MDRAERVAQFRELAQDLDGVDDVVYEVNGQDPLEPIMGEGERSCRIAIFGRDPGRD